MLTHHITKYSGEGKQYVSSWLQLNIFGKIFCFSRKVIEVTGPELKVI